MFCSSKMQFAFFLLFIVNALTGCDGSQIVFWRYLVCKEAWPVVSHNEDAAPEPSNGWQQPTPSYWNRAKSPPAISPSNWGPEPAGGSAWAAAPVAGSDPSWRQPAPAGPYSVWVPAPSPESPSSANGWQDPVPSSSKWVRAPVPPTSCSLLLDDDSTPTDPACFEETHEIDGSLRVYCRLHCEQTPFGGEIFFIKADSENTECIKYVNYNVELRGNDWYAWRSGTCLKEVITFRARCLPQIPPVAPAPEPNGD